MDVIYTIVEFFVQGGIFMYPILLVFVIGVAIAVERYVTLTLLTNKNQSVWAQVQPLLVVHQVLNTKTAQIVAGLEMASVKMLNAIQSTAKRQFQVAA